MSRRKSFATATAGASLLAACLLSGCSSTTAPLALQTAQCPTPPRYDPRLLVAPCELLALTEDPNDPLAIVGVTRNNQCAKSIRLTLIELQRVTKEQLSNAHQ